MMRPLTLTMGLTISAASLCCGIGPALAQGHDDGTPLPQEEHTDDLPLAAARRWLHLEPSGDAPSPWIALSGAYDTGVAVNGDTAWTALRVNVPVARRYGAVDVRLVADYDRDGLDTLGPELILRGVPLRLADGRGALGFALAMYPRMEDYDPLLTLRGGLMGGYLGRWWFAWAHLGVRGEVLQGGYPELLGTAAVGLRLPYGLRPQVEADIAWETRRSGQLTVTLRPALRYWPSEAIGIGLVADLRLMGQEGIEASTIGLDVVFHALE